MKNYLEKYHRLFGSIGALVALAVAIVYFLIVPKEAEGAPVVQEIILTYGHSVCWLLLCVASALWALKVKNKSSVYLAYAALAMYIIFIATLLLSQFA